MTEASVSNVVNFLITKLFESERRRLEGIVSKLNRENKLLQHAQVDGFIHAGCFYMPKDATLRTIGAKPALHKSLDGEMEAYLADKNTIEQDSVFIRQALFTLLQPCKSDQAIRDTLPECLVNCYPNMSVRSRMNETAHTIKDNPRALRQFENVLPKMEFYSVAKLLY